MNFLCISNHNNDLSWIKDYQNPYVIYDRSDNDLDLKDLNVIKSPNLGYNIYDICTFIIDNYENLPDYTTFCKGNIFPRHISREKFEKLMNNKCFTPLFDYKLHNPKMPICMFSSDGCYSELNNSWYMFEGKPRKYFNNYNEFLEFIFVEPLIPIYNTFAPGGNYVVPKNNILKYNITFYENLRTFVSHSQFSNESHIIERALYSIWMCDFEVNEKMKQKIN